MGLVFCPEAPPHGGGESEVCEEAPTGIEVKPWGPGGRGALKVWAQILPLLDPPPKKNTARNANPTDHFR